MALDTMGLMGGTDVLREISMRLEESHLTYLQLDESPLKLQARQKLEGFIKEYLCHVPNERKYVFQETADILHRSAATVKDFSGYRACTAWRALSLYAANLLAQPWRKEYRTLRTYSGYYKHEIEANLIGAELMFELMGYKHTGLGVLTLEGPIDPDRVSNVSRDAIVAFVECQILKEIWENVSQKFTVSWLEVLEFRCNSVGTPEQAIRALNFRFLERLHQTREKNSSTSYRDYINAQQPMGIEVPIPPLVGSAIPYHAMAKNYNTAMMPSTCKPESVYPLDGNYYFTPMDPMNFPNRCSNPYLCRPSINHYYPLGQAQLTNSMTMPGISGSHVTRVPTGRLIELDPPLPVANFEMNRPVLNEISNRSTKSRSREVIDDDEVDFRRNNTCPNFDDYARVDKRPNAKISRHNVNTKDDDWEFVYKNLESRGYSKDLGERDDVLRKKDSSAEGKSSGRSQLKNSRSLVPLEPEDKYEKHGGIRSARDERKRISNAAQTSKPLSFNESNLDLTNGQENRSNLPEFRKKASSLDFTQDSLVLDPITDQNFSSFEKNGKKYSNTLNSLRNIYKNVDAQLEARVFKKQDSEQTLSAERWSCGTCTFLNSREREICEMCGKSKRKGNEDKPLASGGKECPQCTLVNDKNASQCEVCSASLKDSPTYI
ncbi:uncharacterized protein tamo [Venturia canescens]|uniref:uncharacterized protein tamo n=1 Tax=Venturia canescens TaxID=32260 RepID=UPI001C9CDD3A|nr:uncharacterized protein LOC122414032 [Venturia canescens]